MTFKLNFDKLGGQDSSTISRKDDILFGTGMTKQQAERAERKSEKQQSIASDDKQMHPHDANEMHDTLNIKFATSLVDNSIVLDDSQQEALTMLLKNQFGVIIGAAGTGKTTTLKSLVHRLLAENPDEPMTITFGAYTGRAVQQIKRALPVEFHERCDTIHGILEFAPEYVDVINDEGELEVRKRFMPRRTHYNQLPNGTYIIDEAGMFSIELWHQFLDALPSGARVYFVGDINQLPPTHGRSVLGFAMKKWPTAALQKVHRTEENSIIDGAWNILNGRTPEPASGKIVMKRISDNSLEAFKEIVAVVERLHSNGVFDPLRDGIIVPQNKDTLGQVALNERLCAYFNQPQYDDNNNIINPRIMVTSGRSHHALAVGDKMMVTQNDRDEGITNGMTCVITRIEPNPRFQGETVDDMAAKLMMGDVTLDLDDIADIEFDPNDSTKAEIEESERQTSHTVTVKFQTADTELTFSTAGALNTLIHAYAFTCHKSQGGEYPVVIIVAHSANFRMLCREWLYTAWTRAQAKIIFLYNSRGLQMCLNNQRIRGNTIEEKAEAFLKLQEQSNSDATIKVPDLPEPYEFDIKPEPEVTPAVEPIKPAAITF